MHEKRELPRRPKDPRRVAAARRPSPLPDRLNRPDALDAPAAELVEVPPRDRDLARFINAANSYLRLYRMGECSIIVTKEFGRWHVSLAHPRRDPTWIELSTVRYKIIPNSVTMAMILPPVEHFVNLHRWCLHLVEIPDPDLALAAELGGASGGPPPAPVPVGASPDRTTKAAPGV